MMLLKPKGSFPAHDEVPAHIEAFWTTFSWVDNPWICGPSGEVLITKRYPIIPPRSLKTLQIKRLDDEFFTVQVSKPDGRGQHHVRSRLKTWFIAILAATPPQIRDKFGDKSTAVQLRRMAKLSPLYTWQFTGKGIVQGTPHKEAIVEGSINLSQLPDGINRIIETFTGNPSLKQDALTLQEYEENEGIVIEASPLVHRIPWQVEDSGTNRKVLTALKRQPFWRFKTEIGSKLGPILGNPKTAADRTTWDAAVQDQSSKGLWQRQGTLTDFHCWTGYRIALR